MSRKKLLILCYEYPPIGGGGAKVVAGLINQFRHKALDIDLVTMWYRTLKMIERVDNLTIHRAFCIRRKKSVCIPSEMILYLVTGFFLAYRLQRKNHYWLNHTHFIFPDGLISLLLKKATGLPYVITAHGSDVPGYNPDRFRLLHRILLPLWKEVARNAECIICPSATIETLILKCFRKAKTTIIPNGIEVDRFRADLKKEAKILLVTRMFERKGVQYFLQAIRGLDEDFQIHIVGDGPYLERLKEMAKQYNLQVKFHGCLPNRGLELKDLFETSRIFVFTSEAENFPVVLLEAMTAGMAILTTRGTGCAEVVGESGILVRVKNPNAIRENLIILMRDPELCHKLGKAARERVEKYFIWEVVAEKYLLLYEQGLLRAKPNT